MALISLVIVIFIHHAGHWVVAKRYGLDVNRSPLSCCDPSDAGGFGKVPAGRRLLLVVSGLVASYLFAVLPLTALGMRETLVNSLTVGSVEPGFPAAEAGVQAGDVLVRLDGAPLLDFGALRDAVIRAPDSMRIGLQRGDQALEVELRPALLATGQPAVGIVPKRVPSSPSIGEAFAAAHRLPWTMMARLFEPRVEVVGGPVALYALSTQSERGSWLTVLYAFWVSLALYSLVVGGLHLLPLPGLDGWLLLMGLRELATRKAPDYAFAARARAKALWVLLGLGATVFLLVLKNDVTRLLR